jgi:hypothetical protein
MMRVMCGLYRIVMVLDLCRIVLRLHLVLDRDVRFGLLRSIGLR